jgi:hypothetical protein
MHSFFLAFGVGIGIIFSLLGWGALVAWVLRLRLNGGLGFHAALGLAFSTSVGGFLDFLHAITPFTIRIYLLAGLLIAIFAASRHVRILSDRLASSWTYLRSKKLAALLALLIASIAIVKYAGSVSPGHFNPQDDYHAYFVFPVKMLQTGSLGSAPFSERRLVASLGGKSFLDTFPLSVTGDIGTLSLMDGGVAFLIFLLLMAEIMIRKKIPAFWLLTALLAASMFPAPTANITAVYSGIVLLLLLFDFSDRTIDKSAINHVLFLAIVLASLSTLKTTFAPMAGVFFCSFFLVQAIRLPSKSKTVARAGLCAVAIVILLFPWMVDSYQSSGTLFYPLLGKGFHGSRYGNYPLPSANMGLRNVLAFFNGLANALCAVLAALVCLVLYARAHNRRDHTIEVIVIINVLIDIILIGAGIGGYQMYRYSFAIIFAAVVFLLTEQLAVFANSSGLTSPVRSPSAVVAAGLLLGMLLGVGGEGFLGDLKAGDGFAALKAGDGLAALRLSISGNNIVDAPEIRAYHDMQLSIPPGQKVLVRLDKNFLLDFRRNTIYIDDLPGGASPPPGIPVFKGSEALAQYLVQHGIHYVAYSYADDANFSRALFSDRLNPKVNVWIRKGAQVTFDFQDNIVTLARSRKKLFDDGKMFVLDLAAPVPDYSAVTKHESSVAALNSTSTLDRVRNSAAGTQR